MAGNNWLASKRSVVAAERILDAAGVLFARQPAATIGMHEIAAAAGCSRATLYRYFENRQALYTAYVNREAFALHQQIVERLSGIDDPRGRLVNGFLSALDLVRSSPALQSWFSPGESPIGARIAEQSDVIKAMVSAFVISLGGSDEPAALDRKARWLVRVLTSLLVFPGRDPEDERAMIEEFVAPIVTPSRIRAGSPSSA